MSELRRNPAHNLQLVSGGQRIFVAFLGVAREKPHLTRLPRCCHPWKDIQQWLFVHNQNCRQSAQFRYLTLSPAEAPYGKFVITLGLGGRAGNDRKWEGSLFSLPPSHHSPRAAAFPSPQSYRQETFTVKAARKRPLRRREGI